MQVLLKLIVLTHLGSVQDFLQLMQQTKCRRLFIDTQDYNTYEWSLVTVSLTSCGMKHMKLFQSNYFSLYMHRDAYQVLGIQQNCNDDTVIKRQYQKMAREFHPDRKKFAPQKCHEMMQLVNWAYDQVKDSESRQKYRYSQISYDAFGQDINVDEIDEIIRQVQISVAIGLAIGTVISIGIGMLTKKAKKKDK